MAMSRSDRHTAGTGKFGLPLPPTEAAAAPDPPDPLAALMARLAPVDGASPTALSGVACYRSSYPTTCTASVYESMVFIVGQGCKRAYHGGQAYTYDARNYLVLSVPLPVEAEVVEASPERPFLTLGLLIDPDVIGELLLESGETQAVPDRVQTGISAATVSEPLYDAAVRLLSGLAEPQPSMVLARLYLKEIYWFLLMGPQGDFLRANAMRRGQFHGVAKALRRIRDAFNTPLDVASLAGEARMSTSTFHEAFKAVTALSPMQYLKQIRLHKARSLMVFDGLNAAEAAYRVGYNSASQFSREFKRQFGLPPSKEVTRMGAT
jgi:AraC-like DNA-binding protein